jgi:hypothetical protein
MRIFRILGLAKNPLKVSDVEDLAQKIRKQRTYASGSQRADRPAPLMITELFCAGKVGCHRVGVGNGEVRFV